MVLGEKEFKKPILDELGQNWANIENWRRNHDQRIESWKNDISLNALLLFLYI